jgi:hypothetical protein
MLIALKEKTKTAKLTEKKRIKRMRPQVHHFLERCLKVLTASQSQNTVTFKIKMLKYFQLKKSVPEVRAIPACGEGCGLGSSVDVSTLHGHMALALLYQSPVRCL